MSLLLFRVVLVGVVSLAAYQGGGEGIVAGLTYYGPVDVHYPFFLANDDPTTPKPYCGYPGMAITRDSHCAWLRLDGNNYCILGINYRDRTITLAERDQVLINSGTAGKCPAVTHNVTVPPGTWLNPSATTNDNLFFFINCTFTGNTPPPPDIPPINCSSRSFFPNGNGTSSSFVVPQAEVRGEDEWPRACEKVVVVPVLKGWTLPPNFNGDGYGKVLRRGFQLSWDSSAGPCKGCEETKGKCSHDHKGEFLGCLCSDGTIRNSDCGLGSSEKRKLTYIVSAVTGSLLLCPLLSICVFYQGKFDIRVSWKWGPKHPPTIESFLQMHEAPQPKRYTYFEVKEMTKSFTHKLGKGGFGTVYKGILPNGREVAVKLLKFSKDDGKEFMNEVASIMRTSHVNVVALLGYCIQGLRGALIYEYMPNGSLERFTFGQNSEMENSLSWEKLFDIIVRIARGLEYLHHGCSTQIVHFDIKPHNILLDQDFCPKISDFGLAKLCMKKESVISIDGARGTIGYIAPEVFSQQVEQISSKSDVYSFGMMVLEMVGARNNINNSSTSSKYFPEWVYERLEEYHVNAGEISVDTSLVRKLIVVGLWCIQLQPNNRPSMTKVLEMLESRVDDLQIPPPNPY